MCRENKFTTIKFATDVRGYPSGMYLNVYLTMEDFENGKIYMKIKFIQKEYNQSSNIKDDTKNYELYIDNNLISVN